MWWGHARLVRHSAFSPLKVPLCVCVLACIYIVSFVVVVDVECTRFSSLGNWVMVLSPSSPTQGPPPWWQQRTSECSRTGFFGYQWWLVWRGEEEERDPRGAPAAHQKEHPTCRCSSPLASQPVTERRKREGVCGAVGGSNKLRHGPEVSCSCLFTHFIIIIVITIFSCGLSSSWCCSDEVCPPFPSAGVFTHPQMFHTSSSHAIVRSRLHADLSTFSLLSPLHDSNHHSYKNSSGLSWGPLD